MYRYIGRTGVKGNMRTQGVILIADDNPTLCALIRTVLQKEGYKVLVAGDGSAALQASRNYRGNIDLLLTDIEMPRMDGISAYRQIRAERANIKVLFVSGAADSLTLAAGFAFLPKPFANLDALRARVREVLTEAPASHRPSSASFLP